MFKLQSPSKSSPFDAIYLSRVFHCSKQFLNSSILMPFSASAIFCFTSSTMAKCFPLKIFFIKGKQKKIHSGMIGWIRRLGHGGRVICAQKLLNLSMVWAGVLIYHPPWNGQIERVFKKHSLKLNAASHKSASWYTDTDRFLEHSSRRAWLYYKRTTFRKIIPFGGSPPHTIARGYLPDKAGLVHRNY